MTNPTYLNKQLATTSSTGIGGISTAVPSVVTFITSVFSPTGQRIELFSTNVGDASGLKVTFTGTIGNRSGTISEVLSGSTANGVAQVSNNDFISISAISISSNANFPMSIGISSIGSTPWKSIDNLVRGGPQVAGEITFSSTANSMTASLEFTMDDIWGVNPSTQALPTIYKTTTGLSSATGPIVSPLNFASGVYVPATAYRMTLTSSSSGAGSVVASVIQANTP